MTKEVTEGKKKSGSSARSSAVRGRYFRVGVCHCNWKFEISEARSDELPFLGAWRGWLSLIAFAIIAYSLITVPLGRKAPAGDTK